MGVTVVLALGLFGCAYEGSQYSPEQVIQNAMEEVATVGAYYSEEKIVSIENGEETERFVIKTWHGEDGKIRTEMENEDGGDKTISVNDGASFTTYFVDQNEVSIFEDPEHSFTQPSPKEQASFLLETIKDTHSLSVKGTEEVAGRTAYHLVAKANEENALLGDLEVWVDEENWMVLKTISKTADMEVEAVYTKIDFEMEIPSTVFTLELPDDVKVQNLDDLYKTTELSLEEVAQVTGNPTLHFPAVEGMDISKIESFEMEGEVARKEVSIEYEKEGLPLLTLSIFQSSEEIEEIDTLPGEKTAEIRGQKGGTMEFGDFRAVTWQEGGLSYSIIIVDPNLTLEEVIEWAAEMELIE